MGSLYPENANAFAEPTFSFELDPSQAIPKIASGAKVEVLGPCEAGSRPVIVAGDVEVIPKSHLGKGGFCGESRLFAERGDLIVHPTLSGRVPTWQNQAPVSFDDLADWERRLRRDTRAGWGLLTLTVLFLAVFVFGAVNGSGPPIAPTYVFAASGGAGTIVTYRLWRRAHTARAMLRRARQALDHPPTQMTMTIQWLVGHGDGPLALARLEPLPAETANRVWAVPVINVSATLAEGGQRVVDVYGDPGSDTVAIRAGDTILWPDSPLNDEPTPIDRPAGT